MAMAMAMVAAFGDGCGITGIQRFSSRHLGEEYDNFLCLLCMTADHDLLNVLPLSVTTSI